MYSVQYNFSAQFDVNYTLSSNSSLNKIIVSLAGFYVAAPQAVGIYLFSYMMNTSYYAVAMQTSDNDYWYRLNVIVCIINVEEFPSTVNVSLGTVVLSASNSTQQFDSSINFANISYCFGLVGFQATTPDKEDVYWKELNSSAIQVNLSNMTYGWFSYIAIWNLTTWQNNTTPVNPDPVNPVTPVNPVDPITPTEPQSTGSSSSSIGIIIGVVVGVFMIGLVTAYLIYRFRNKFGKGTRIPIPENQKDSHLFMPSFN